MITTLLADIISKSGDSDRILMSLRIIEAEDSTSSADFRQNRLLFDETLSERDRQLYGDYYES